MYIRVTSRGRITLPIELRRKRGWKAATCFVVYDDGDRIALMPVKDARSSRGMLKGKHGIQALIEDRRVEKYL
jgi:AbrB family looped-hinge helix DNA binding protein